MSFSNYFEEACLNHMLRGGSYGDLPLAFAYAGLLTDPLGSDLDASYTEVADADGYARAVFDFAPPTDGSITNYTTADFPEATGGGWGMVNWFAVFSAQGYGFGNMLIYGPLAGAPIEIVAGSVPRFAVGKLTITLD